MGMAFTALILICAAGMEVPRCGIDTAIDVVQGPEVHSIYDCGFSGQAMIASTALTPGLGREKYLKIVCVEKERLKAAPRVTGG
jgi:hypothetical protein